MARFFSSAACSKKILAVIIGPPGSGKGTIAERILKEFNLRHLSSGDILRSHILQKTVFGKKIEPLVSTGQLVPFELLAPLMEYEVGQTKTGWLLDGYPRSSEQAKSLNEKHPPNLAIYLNVPFLTIIDRIKSRWIHMPSGRVYNLEFNPPKAQGKDDVTGEALVQREDDKPDSVTKRLQIYKEMITPVLDFYKEKKILHEFSGTESNVIWPYVKSFLVDFEKRN